MDDNFILDNLQFNVSIHTCLFQENVGYTYALSVSYRNYYVHTEKPGITSPKSFQSSGISWSTRYTSAP